MRCEGRRKHIGLHLGHTARRGRAGPVVRISMPVTACPGIIHGDVVSNSNHHRGSHREKLPGMLGHSDGVLVGTFDVHAA